MQPVDYERELAKYRVQEHPGHGSQKVHSPSKGKGGGGTGPVIVAGAGEHNEALDKGKIDYKPNPAGGMQGTRISATHNKKTHEFKYSTGDWWHDTKSGLPVRTDTHGKLNKIARQQGEARAVAQGRGSYPPRRR